LAARLLVIEPGHEHQGRRGGERAGPEQAQVDDRLERGPQRVHGERRKQRGGDRQRDDHAAAGKATSASGRGEAVDDRCESG
jgi:hypothetical protein